MRLLLVEDDEMLGHALQGSLTRQHYVVEWSRDGSNIIAGLKTEHFDVIIMDLGLPKRDGIHLIEDIRAKNISVPVLILTARDDTQQKVRGLDAGADDYLLKPFDLNELCARLRALTRRSTQKNVAIRYGDITMVSDSHQVFNRGELVALSRREYMLLETFLNRPNCVFTRQQLEQSIYGWQDDIGSNALEVHIHYLRKKIRQDLIKTVRGVGYVLNSPNGEST